MSIGIYINVSETLGVGKGISAGNNVSEVLTVGKGASIRNNVTEILGAAPYQLPIVSITVFESITEKYTPSFASTIYVSEVLESERNISLYSTSIVLVLETLEQKLDAIRASVFVSESLERIGETMNIVLVYEELIVVYNATPTRTPTITPPPTQTYTPPPTTTLTPSIFPRDVLTMCSKVNSYEDLGSGLRLYQTSGNPLVIIDPKTSGSVAIQPHSSVATLYQYICSNYWFCGFRVYVLINCYGGLCAVSLNSLGANSNIPDSVSLRVFGDLARMRVSIRAKEESSFGFGALVWYLVLEYTMNDGYEAEVETPIWSWAFSVSSEHKEPYPIQIYSRNYYDVYDCSKLEMSRCPWRGAWHSTVSCAIYEFFRFMWNMIYSILPQPVKDFLNLIYAFLSGVTSVLSLALNPTFITMFTILIFSVFALFLVYLLLEKGPIGIIEFFATVKEFVGSVVDWILKLINTLKP